MSSDEDRALVRLLRRLDRPLTRRPDQALPFVSPTRSLPRRTLLDTTVYIDQLQGRMPPALDAMLVAAPLYHCAVTEAEVLAVRGHLDPGHPGTATAAAKLIESVTRRPPHRCLSPDRDIWRRAGVIAGRLGRLQGYGREGRGRLLNDALIFLTAAKAGCCVLTRNIADFDLLMQVELTGHALFYRAD